MKTQITCPLCESKRFFQILIRKNIPVHQNLIFKDKKSAIKTKRGNLNMVMCLHCGFVFNKSFDHKKLNYGGNYDNAQHNSSFFEKYLDYLIDYLLKQKNSIFSIAEIGCGDGFFLKKFIKKSPHLHGVGFDPSYKGSKTVLNRRLVFKREYFTSSSIEHIPDLVICRHVIEHIKEPLQMIQNISKILFEHQESHIFFETPDVKWTLQNKVLYDFTYEHCSLFNKSSLSFAFHKAGFKILKVQNQFGGQYIWLEAKPSTSSIPTILNNSQLFKLAKKYRTFEDKTKKLWYKKILEYSKKGNVALWGAAGKGTSFINLFDPDCKLIDSIIDINPNKWNKHIAGTGHIIIDPISIIDRKIKTIIVMNPNYYNEIKSYLYVQKIKVDLIK